MDDADVAGLQMTSAAFIAAGVPFTPRELLTAFVADCALQDATMCPGKWALALEAWRRTGTPTLRDDVDCGRCMARRCTALLAEERHEQQRIDK